MKTVYISCSEVAAAVGRHRFQSQADLARKILDGQFQPPVSNTGKPSTVPSICPAEPVSVAKHAVQQWIETNRHTAVLALAKEKMSHIETARSVRQKTHEQAEQLQRTVEHAVITSMVTPILPPDFSQALENGTSLPSNAVQPVLRLDDILSEERQKVESLTLLLDEQLKHKRRVDESTTRVLASVSVSASALAVASTPTPSSSSLFTPSTTTTTPSSSALSVSPVCITSSVKISVEDSNKNDLTPVKGSLTAIALMDPVLASIAPQIIEKCDEDLQHKQLHPSEQVSTHDQQQQQPYVPQAEPREQSHILTEALRAQQLANLQHVQAKQNLLEQAEKLRKLEEAAVEIAAIPSQLHQTVSKLTGTLAEDAIVNSIEKDLAKQVKHRNTTMKYKAIFVQEGWRVLVGGKPDGLIIDSATGATRVVEVKNRQNRLFRSVPEYERVQVQVYLWLFSADMCTFRENFHGETWSTDLQHDSVEVESIRMKLVEFVKQFIIPPVVSIAQSKSDEMSMESN